VDSLARDGAVAARTAVASARAEINAKRPLALNLDLVATTLGDEVERPSSLATVGRDETGIREYIRNQEVEDKRLDQLKMWK